MGTANLFSGSALATVAPDGSTILPSFVVRALERRCGSSRLVLAAHEADPCISGYDEAHEAVLFEEVERRRLREEALGLSTASHFARVRRTFGGAETASFDPSGRVVLSGAVRRRGRIGPLALFVGAGANFEIWNPDLARSDGGEEMRELAELAFLRTKEAEERELW